MTATLKPAKGITIKLAFPERYAPCRGEVRKKAKGEYPGASVRTRIVSRTGFPTVEEVRFTKNHPLAHSPGSSSVDFAEIIITSFGEKLLRWAIAWADSNWYTTDQSPGVVSVYAQEPTVVLLTGYPDEVVDDEAIKYCAAKYTGTVSYETASGSMKTVRSFKFVRKGM